MTENHPVYNVSNERLTIERFSRLSCCRPAFDPDYKPPKPNEIRFLLSYLGLSGGEAARLLGVSKEKSGSRTVRRWIGGERPITYATWRLLLAAGGIADPAYDLNRLKP